RARWSNWRARWRAGLPAGRACRDHDIAAPETTKILVHMPGRTSVLDLGLSVVDARIPSMTTAFDDTGQHPVTSAIAAVSQLLHDIADLGLWTLPAPKTETNLTALARLRHQITELELRHAQHADRLDLGAAAGATDT